MLKRILVGLGGTPFSAVATRRAVELASKHDAELTGVTVVDVNRLSRLGPVPAGAGAYAERLRDKRLHVTEERVDQAIQRFEEMCSEAGVRHTVERETGDAFDLVISHARYHDLIVFGLRSLFDYGIVEDPRDALIRLVSRGVRPILAAAPEYREVRRVLIAYSGSMESAKAMKRFAQLRPFADVSVRIVCFEMEQPEAEALLGDAAAYCRAHGYDAETHYSPENPEDHLLRYAQDQDADLIVMGNSLRNVLFQHVLGGTMLRMIREADRPLLLAQ